MSTTVKRLAIGLTSATAIAAAFLLAATPPAIQPASGSSSTSTLTIKLESTTPAQHHVYDYDC